MKKKCSSSWLFIKNWAVLGCYTARSGNSVLTFRDNLSVPSSRAKNSRSRHRGVLCVISGFRRDVHEHCALMDHYTASSGDSLPTFRDNLSFPSEFTYVGCCKLSQYSASSAAGRAVNQISIPGRSRGVPLLQNRGAHLDSCLVSTGAKAVGTWS